MTTPTSTLALPLVRESFGHLRRVCVASACVRVGFMSEKGTLLPFDGTYSVGGVGFMGACGEACAELEVRNASRDMSWPICAFPGPSAVTVEPSLGALRRDGNAERMLGKVRSAHTAEVVMERCVWRV